MKILITGANGQLGLELRKQLAQTDWEVFGASHRDMDITKLEEVKRCFNSFCPDVVVNCAAHTQVDLCEEQVERAFLINGVGAQNVAQACQGINAKLVHISTDYVFAGDDPLPRREMDALGPQTVYGSSKLYGEEAVKRFCSRYFIIRTAWLYGDGNNFVRTMLKLGKTQQYLKVVGDQVGSPTSTKDLARVILALAQTEFYGLYHGTCQGACSWYNFAVEIFRQMNRDVQVEKVTSEEFIRAAKRPAFSVLDNFLLRLRGLDSFRSWQEALADYLGEDIVWQNSHL